MGVSIGDVLIGYGGYLALKSVGGAIVEMGSTESIDPSYFNNGECKMQCLECGVVFKGCLTPDYEWVESLSSQKPGYCPNCGEYGKVAVISKWTKEDSLNLLKVGHPKILKKPSPPAAPEAPEEFSLVSILLDGDGFISTIISVVMVSIIIWVVVDALFFKGKPLGDIWPIILVCGLFPGICTLIYYFGWKWHKEEVKQYNEDMKKYKKAMEEYNKRYKI